MPIYPWEHETGARLEVVRRVNEIELPPTKEEIAEAFDEPAELMNGAWIRVMGTGIQKKLSNSWGFGKPNSKTPRLSKRIR